MEYGCIDKGIVERDSCDNQKRSEKKIDELEKKVQYLPNTHGSIGIFCIFCVCFYGLCTTACLCICFIHPYISVQENTRSSDDDKRSEDLFDYVR